MDDHFIPDFTENEPEEPHKTTTRMERLRAQQKKQRSIALAVLLAVLAVSGLFWLVSSHPSPQAASSSQEAPPAALSEETPFSAQKNRDTADPGPAVVSPHAILIDIADSVILAERDSRDAVSPASMTKILTLLVAAEHLTEADLDASFTMTAEIADYCYTNDCSVVGLIVGESVPVRELLYGTILTSGADAALGLAHYIAGSQEAFVELMNEKLRELDLGRTAHFTNCVGLYSEDHTCSMYDTAVILKSALDNELCRDVLSAHTYQTVPTPQHPEGQTLSNWFLRKIEDHDIDLPARAVAAKTGFVLQSGNCAASYAERPDGRGYLCVTAGAQGSWRAIYDHMELYRLIEPVPPEAPPAETPPEK